MAEQVENTLDNTQSMSADFDLQGVNDPMDAMGSFDLQELDQNTDGPGDPVKPKPVTMGDLQKGYDIQMQQLKQLATAIPEMADKTRNKLQAARVVEFDAKKLNIDRYLGYGKETFNKVGFSPFVDNEKNFNQNTTIWQDFGRMSSVFGALAYEGGVSGYRSIGGMLSGDSFYTPDDETAENFARLQSIGMSTKGGIGSFVNNFALNSAYTVGIGLSILAEEAAMFGLTVATEGAFGGMAAARTASNAGRLGRAVKQAFNTNAVKNIATGGFELAKSLSKVGDAKDFYSSIKAGSTTFGKGVFQFINPLTRTTDDVLDIMRGSASMRNLSNLAKAKQTFGSFYRDIRDTNLALSESKLEGGSAKIDKVNELLARYESENGKPAEGADLQRIYQEAEDVGYGVTAVNFPIIYATNRVVLDGLFKFRGLKTLDEAAEMATKGIGFKKGVGFYDALADGWVKNTTKNLLNPKVYLGMGVGYFRRNLMEGVQENLQNVTSDAVSAYYDGVYKDKSLGGFDYAAGHAWNALGKEVTSMRGLETFASGFLMGGFMGKAQNLFVKDVPGIYYRVAQPEKYAEYKQNKINSRKEAVNGLNELYSNPMKYFSSRNESAVVQKQTSDVMNQAEDAGDAKTFQDAKDLKMFDHIFTALDNGTYDGLLGAYKELSKLDNNDLASFLGIKETDKASNKLQEIISRAEQIKDRYDTINDQFKNPFMPKKLKKGTPEFTREAIAFKAFETAKKTAVASQYGFDRALERMNGLYGDLSSNRPVGKASSSDITILTDINTLNDEIALLDREVKSYEGATDKDQKKIAKEKADKLDRLMDYRDKLRTHLEAVGKSETEENGQITINFGLNTADPLKESYKNYLRHIAAVNNDYMFDDKVDDSFTKLLDYYNLDNNAANYNKVVNTLLDPANLYKHAERLNNKFTELFENKNADINERVERAQRTMEISEMVKALAAQGVMMDPEQLEEFVRTGKKPTSFIDAATLKDIDTSSPKWAAIQAILDIDKEITAPDVTAAPVVDTPAPAATTTETAPVTTTPAAPSTIDVGLEPELQIKLEDAYNQYIEETGSEMSFEEFVKISPRAARIKKAFNKDKAPAAAPVVEQTPADTTPVSDIEAKKADIERKVEEEKKQLQKNVLYNGSERKFVELKPGGPVQMDDIEGKNEIFISLKQRDGSVKFGKARRESNGLWMWTIAPIGNSGLTDAELFDSLYNYKIRKADVVAERDYDAELAALEGAKPAEDAPSVAANALDDLKQLNASLQTGDEKTAEEKLAAIKIQPDQAAPVLDLNAGLVKVFTEERDKKLSDLMPVYALARKTMMQKGYDFLDLEDRNILADPIKWMQTQIENEEEGIKQNKLLALKETFGEKDSKEKREKEEKIKRAIESANVRIQKSKITLKKLQEIIAEYNDKMSRIGQTPVAAKPATEDTTSTEPKQEDEKTQTPAEKTGTQKAQDLIDSVSSIRDLPDLTRADSGPVTIDLIELISTGQARSKEVVAMLAKKRTELLQNISTKDLQKGDIVTFVDGRKGFVKSVNPTEVSIKMTGSQQGVTDIVAAKDLPATIANVEPAKLVSMEPTPDIEVTPQEQTEVKASQDTKSAFTENSAAVKQVGDTAAKAAGTDNLQNLNNLIQNIGCKTGN